MSDNKREIKKGITSHIIKTDKFKTDLIAVFLTTKLTREDVTKNAMIPMILRKGSSKLENIEEINKQLEEMYGAGFDCGVDKTGDNQVLKFYLETIDNKYLPEGENILTKGITTLLDLVFSPKIENSAFKKEYLETEKENLRQIIEGKKDNKAQYASLRCQEEMYKDTPFGLYKYGYLDDIDEINERNLYEYYKSLISKCKIDIFVSGDVEENDIINIIQEDKNIQELCEREPEYNTKSVPLQKHKENKIIEKMDVTQGNLVLGLSIDKNDKREKYVAVVYNAILGGSATSKMFQIVREKHSLAYTASSNYLRHKNCIFVRCGIEIDNFEKTFNLIKEQLEDMKNGKFTDEDIENAKTGVISIVKLIPEEQDTEITYYFGQTISENNMTFEEYEGQVNNVTREEIMELAKKVEVDTVYFLRN